LELLRGFTYTFALKYAGKDKKFEKHGILKRTEKEENVRKMYSRQRTFYCATDHATGKETGFSICD